MGKAHSKGRAFEQETGKFLLKYNGVCPKWAELTTDCIFYKCYIDDMA